jgi:hypothetical protein
MAVLSDVDLYQRGADTLVASWQNFARHATSSRLVRPHGVAIAIFPDEPERSVYNNALFERGLASTERVDAVEASEDAYREAGISSSPLGCTKATLPFVGTSSSAATPSRRRPERWG